MSTNINVQHVYDSGLCMQCGTCAAVCPHSAIKMDWDGVTGYVLAVEDETCEECGLC